MVSMLNGVHEATKTAKDVIEEIYKDEELSDVEIEEVEWDVSHWLITVGFTRPKMRAALGGLNIPRRTLKRVRISTSTGDFEGMINAPSR